MSAENQHKNGMGVNNAEKDEAYTPFYAVDPILEYIPKGAIVWCPFDKDWSAFVQLICRDNRVVASHIDDGKDFFDYEPNEYDIIISNPPYSLADKVLERLYSLGKPFMIILPTKYIQSVKRVDMFIEKGIQLLSFDKRIGFHSLDDMFKPIEGNNQSSSYFCWKMLPSNLILKKLVKYNMGLIT